MVGLKYLLLAENNIGREEAAALVNLPRVLKSIDLGFNLLDDAGVAAVMQSLAGCSALEMLELGCNAFHDDGVRAIAGGLSGLRALETLSLGGETSFASREAAGGLVAAAALLPRLKELQFSVSPEVTDQEKDELRAMMKGCKIEID